MEIFVRYETPDENGETRRQRNEKFDEITPDFEIPVEARYLWDWFFNIHDMMGARVYDGFCRSIPPSEYLAWAELTGTIVYQHEYDILTSMDAAFCREYNKELQNYRLRREEEIRLKTEEANKKVRR